MKLLVTGGAGFIGRNFIHYMMARYPEKSIVNVDKLTYAGSGDPFVGVDNPNYTFVNADVCDREAIEALVASHQIEAIVHFAAETHVDRSIMTPNIFVKTNIEGTQVLLDVAKAYGVQRYVQVSTDEVYGTLGETGIFTEDTPLAPNSPYAASKASADLLVRAYYETYGLNASITRCGNNYGPYQFPEKLIPLMIVHALTGRSLPIYGDGAYVRDWIHVEDHCAAIDLVLHEGKKGEVYNIGGHEERTNNDIVKQIVNALRVSPSLIRYVGDRPGHDRRYAVDATKLKSTLGWRPKYTFEEGLAQTMTWYQTHRDWWERLHVEEVGPSCDWQ
ncbi:dTDP-glucose 4,6-dehydratase [Shouchella lonarensis]|uniref:dTDP-glucose 4,6-dehydratase n=1 Tax=Shouchella lonarensis TaxID=1464122 RepID=A0A1G6GYR5_9BACI|nr:dTDP-glucose 4,6-dehydratase [Shouchella lonarensis]SDB87197.1 dTDP-glucose 4,6-dehydratase [Shouchella lonarensis]